MYVKIQTSINLHPGIYIYIHIPFFPTYLFASFMYGNVSGYSLNKKKKKNMVSKKVCLATSYRGISCIPLMLNVLYSMIFR